MPQWNSTRRAPNNPLPPRDGDQSPAAAACLKIVDYGIAGIIFVGPHLFGGRHLLGRFAILSLCIATAVAWFLRQCLVPNPRWQRSWSMGIVLAAAAMLVIQLLPLPSEWLIKLSPRLTEILPLWTTAAMATRVGQWQILSLAPEETRLALATLLAYGMLFVTTVQRIKSIDDVKRIMQWIGSSAIVVATFGIVQYFTTNGKFFWFYEHPYSDTALQLKAGFTSRNHFAHFLVLGLASLFTWVMIQRNPQRTVSTTRGRQRHSLAEPTISPWEACCKLGLTLGITLVVFAILASLSRGGVLAMASAVTVAAICYSRAGLLRSRHVAAGGLLAVIMMAALSASGDYENLAKRMETLTDKSKETVDTFGGRRTIWSANIAAFKANWLTGSGAGSHRFVYPLYLSEPTTVDYTHAENGYLQIATENGLPGIVLLALTFLCCGYWCVRAMRNADNDFQLQILAGGIASGLAASAVQSFVDFVWFIPACATVTILMIACALRLAQLSAVTLKHSAPHFSIGRVSQLNMALATSLAGVWCLLTLLPTARTALDWDGYVLAENANQLTAERKVVGVPDEQESLAESEQINSESLLRHLSHVVRNYPDCALAHTRFANALLNRFEILQKQAANDMPINQIREAVQESKFATSQRLREWLKTAFGEHTQLLYQAHYHARRAVELCPLQGEAYFYLAELCFLEGRGPADYHALVDQSLLVRPYDVGVLFPVGKSYLIAGNNDEALRIWSTAYPISRKHQRLIIEILVRNMTAANFLKVFHPDWSSLEYLWRNYRQVGNTEDWQAILPYAYQLAKQQAPTVGSNKAGAIWLWLSAMQREVGDTEAALKSLQQAFIFCPDDFSVRFELAKVLLNMKQYEPAEPHFRWCYAQRPDIEYIQTALMQVSRDRMQRLASNTRVKIP